MQGPKRLSSKLKKQVSSLFRSKRRAIIGYAGGKTRGVSSLVPVIMEALDQINDDQLIGPFLGGASNELACQAEGVRVHGYDLDPNLICFYDYLLTAPEQLADEAQKYLDAGVNGNHYAFQQLKQLIPAAPHSLQKAAGYFVANRLSYAGLTFSSGNKAVNTLKPSNIQNIRTFSAPNLSVSLADYRQALLNHDHRTLAYLDPPYDFLKPRYYYGENGNRHRGFDHEALFLTLRDRPNWIMSYNADAPILARYAGFPKAYPCWTYSMNNSRSKEVVIFSKDLAVLAVWAQAHFNEVTAANDNARAKRERKAAGMPTIGLGSSVPTKVGQADLPTLHIVPAANDTAPLTAPASPPPISMAGGWPTPDMSVCSDTITPAPTFPSGVFGNDWQTWCMEVAKGANAHFDYVAMALITAATGLVGNSVTVQGNANFIQPSVLWTCCVGKSGSGKTPAMNALSDIVDELDRSQQSRMRLRDTTVAAAVKMAAQTPKGLLVFRDELSGWWSNMKRLGGEDFWLEAFNGKPYSKDRKSDAPIFIENLSISVIGGAQPSTVKAITTDNKNREFSSRWIFAYPDLIEGYDGGAATPDIEWATNALRRLIELPVGEASIPFSPDGQMLFREWWEIVSRPVV